MHWNECVAVEHEAERVSGAWVFRRTRVPVTSLFENVEAGATIDEFLDWFPGVTNDQVAAVLHYAEQKNLTQYCPVSDPSNCGSGATATGVATRRRGATALYRFHLQLLHARPSSV